jgi:hypothetical protein
MIEMTITGIEVSPRISTIAKELVRIPTATNAKIKEDKRYLYFFLNEKQIHRDSPIDIMILSK